MIDKLNVKNKLQTLELYEEHGSYYLKVVCGYEDNNGKYKFTLPKVALPFQKDKPSQIEFYGLHTYYGGIVKNGINELEIMKDKNGKLYTVETIEKYPHKMTLKEIENKLGYKIELISEK